jgi:hypothetical protein
MATLTVNGVKVTVDDSFKTLSPEEQEATVNEIASQMAAGARGNRPERSGGIDAGVRSVGRGVLGVGSYLDELNAATNATLAPVIDPLLPDKGFEKLPGKTWGERYDQAIGIQRRKDDEFDNDHPYVSTGLKIAGGVGSGGAVLKAAPVVGNYVLGNTGASVGTRVASTVGSGGATGFVQGFGAGEGGAEERAKQGRNEAIVGAGTSLAMMPLAAGVRAGTSRIAKALLGERDDALSTLTGDARKYVINELSNPDKVTRYREALNDLGPEAMLADVSPDWLGVARGSATRPGTRSLVVDPLNERAALANTRLRADVETNLGPDPVPSRIDREIQANQNQVAREYGPVMRERVPFDFTPITDDLDRSVSTLRGDAQRQLQRVRTMLNEFGEDAVTTDPSVAFQTRQAIDGVLATEQNPKVISALTEARQMLDDSLRASVPRIKEVDAQYSELARQREALGQGRQILTNEATAMRPVELDQMLNEGALPEGMLVGPSGVPTRMKQGTLGEIYRAVGTKANDTTALRNIVRGEGDWNREKLGMLFGREPADNVLKAIDRETVFGDTANRVTRGSDTSMASRFGSYLDDIARSQEIPADRTAIGLGLRGANAIARALLQKNSTANASQIAEDVGRLSVAKGPARDAIVEALMKRGQEYATDQQRDAVVRALFQSGGRAGYPSVLGSR